MANDLLQQLESQQRVVDVDHVDLVVRELLRMVDDGALVRPPRRPLHWDGDTRSRFIESLFLGLPVAGLVVAANPDGTWEVIDGVQRLWTLAQFATTRPHVLRELGEHAPLTLTGLDRLTELNGRTLADLPPPIQLRWFKRALRVTALSDQGDREVRSELVRRLGRDGAPNAPEVGADMARGERGARPPERPGEREPAPPALNNARLSRTLAATTVLLDVASHEVRAVAALEPSTLADRQADRQDEAAIRTAGIYLYAAAAIERACREGLLAVIAEINAHGVALDHLRVSLFALHCAASLDAIGGGARSLDRVVRAADMFDTVFGAGHAPLGTVLPLDGRTPRAAHFATIWRVFGFPGPAVPDPACALALEDLAEGRNDVAHGVRDAIAFGRTKPIADVAGVVARVAQMVAHLFASADAYLDQRLFLR
jgi:hypothetical protein